MEINYSEEIDIASKRHTTAVEFKETAKKQNRNCKAMEF